MPQILFICTANRYRSPIAEACFQRELAAHGLGSKWKVSSAGTWTGDGLPALAEAMREAARLGLDLRGHTSRVVRAEILAGADLILVMEQGHKEALCSEFPASAPRVHLLSEAAAGLVYDVPDPVVAPGAGDVAHEIYELVHGGFDRICALIRNGAGEAGAGVHSTRGEL